MAFMLSVTAMSKNKYNVRNAVQAATQRQSAILTVFSTGTHLLRKYTQIID